MPAKDKEQPKAFLIVGDKGEKLPDRWYVFSYDTEKNSSKGNKVELKKYNECKDFKDKKCYKCKKVIGDVNVYICKKDNEFYHQDCLDQGKVNRVFPKEKNDDGTDVCYDEKNKNYEEAKKEYDNIKLGFDTHAKILYNYSKTKNLKEENKPKGWKIKDLQCELQEGVPEEKEKYLNLCKIEANKEEKYKT